MTGPDEQPQRDYPEVPPARVSSDPGHPDFHPSCHRIGVLVDGKLDRRVTFYDARLNRYRLLNDGRRGPEREATRVDVFWLRPESRQERRARERWDAKHRGRIVPAPERPVDSAGEVQWVDPYTIKNEAVPISALGALGAAVALSMAGGGRGPR